MLNIVWLRKELRVSDNPALHGAAREKKPILPLFIWNPEAAKEATRGGASKWWLHHSLLSLSKTFAALGSPLVILAGEPETILPEIAKKHHTDAIFWNRSPFLRENIEDVRVESALQDIGINCRIFSNNNYLLLPDDVRTAADTPFKVFTPFYKQASTVSIAKPLPSPKSLIKPKTTRTGISLNKLNLLPKINWAVGLQDEWQPGEKGAIQRLEQFIEHGAAQYEDMRDYPAITGTSKLSPHLHFGEITPAQIAAIISDYCASKPNPQHTRNTEAFLRQLYWREFGRYLIHYFPTMLHNPMRPEFESFPWREDAKQLQQWQQGQTGYPIVDAGMRELWHTGWMHNRVRMITASFLVKHLLLPWQSGAAWFWDTLVDADSANNILGWQWVSGCGPDAAPYFRIFNPILQGQKFDGNGEYIRHWVPELATLDNKHIHAPWTAPKEQLHNANIILGKDYPEPIVDHEAARQRALDTFAFIKTQRR